AAWHYCVRSFRRLTDDARRIAALLVGFVRKVRALLAPCAACVSSVGLGPDPTQWCWAARLGLHSPHPSASSDRPSSCPKSSSASSLGSTKLSPDTSSMSPSTSLG